MMPQTATSARTSDSYYVHILPSEIGLTFSKSAAVPEGLRPIWLAKHDTLPLAATDPQLFIMVDKGPFLYSFQDSQCAKAEVSLETLLQPARLAGGVYGAGAACRPRNPPPTVSRLLLARAAAPEAPPKGAYAKSRAKFYAK
jgi:hypothetical protein